MRIFRSGTDLISLPSCCCSCRQPFSWHFQDGDHDVISRNKVLPPGQ